MVVTALLEDMKSTEVTFRDLRVIIKTSQLQAEAKNELLGGLEHVIVSRSRAPDDLRSFIPHVNGCFDIVLSNTRWTKRLLETIVERDKQGPIARLTEERVPVVWQLAGPIEQALKEVYIRSSRDIESRIVKRIGEAQAWHQVLKDHANSLNRLKEISLREKISTLDKKEADLTQLSVGVGLWEATRSTWRDLKGTCGHRVR